MRSKTEEFTASPSFTPRSNCCSRWYRVLMSQLSSRSTEQHAAGPKEENGGAVLVARDGQTAEHKPNPTTDK